MPPRGSLPAKHAANQCEEARQEREHQNNADKWEKVGRQFARRPAHSISHVVANALHLVHTALHSGVRPNVGVSLTGIVHATRAGTVTTYGCAFSVGLRAVMACASGACLQPRRHVFQLGFDFELRGSALLRQAGLKGCRKVVLLIGRI